MTVVLEGVSKRYDTGHVAVDHLDLEIHDGEFFTLLGPSGSGKTTTLRMIAGLESVTEGSISIRGRNVTHMPARQRDIAMVFQSYALYPHMSVFDNLALNLKVKKVPKQEIHDRVHQVARMLRIDHVLDRKPGQLSGGQRQRVALGRAIVRRPNVFLMDEPLSNLDLKLREETRTELKKLHENLRITTIYVTHDQSEALVLSDRIAVMNEGRLLQVGNPHEVYAKPVDVFVARFIGSPSINLLHGQVRERDGALAIEVPQMNGYALLVHVQPDRAEILRTRGMSIVGIRPEDLVISTSPIAGHLPARVDFIQPMGSISYVILRLESNAQVIVERDHIIAATGPEHEFSRGTAVWLTPKANRYCVFDRESGKAIW